MGVCLEQMCLDSETRLFSDDELKQTKEIVQQTIVRKSMCLVALIYWGRRM